MGQHPYVADLSITSTTTTTTTTTPHPNLSGNCKIPLIDDFTSCCEGAYCLCGSSGQMGANVEMICPNTCATHGAPDPNDAHCNSLGFRKK